MSVPKLGQFGEPWVAEEGNPNFQNVCAWGGIAESVHGYIVADIWQDTDTEWAALAAKRAGRIVACVNALDGRDPDALKALEQTAQNMVEAWDAGSPTRYELDQLRAALAAFGVKS